MTAEEKQLMENILTAEILILAKCKAILDRQERPSVRGGESSYEIPAIKEIKDSKSRLIQQLLS